jgi:phosphoserine phosphatase
MLKLSCNTLIAALLMTVLTQSQATQTDIKFQLDQGKWAPTTRAAIEQLITRHAVPDNTAESERAYAVFDWDDTSIINDVTDKFFLYQMDQLAYKLNPTEFSEVLRRSIPDKPLADSVKNLAGKPISFTQLTSDIERDYRYLYKNYEGMAGKQSLATITQSDAFKDFKAKLYFLFGAIIDSHGQLVAYPWEIFFCANMTESEVDALALASIRHSLQTGIAKVELTSPLSQAGQSGQIKTSFNDGMRVVPEIANLMHVLQRNGIDVFVVSAGFEPLVRTIATRPEFGYQLPANHVFGLRLESNDQGQYLAQSKKDYPVSYREGKPALVRQLIAPGKGDREPVLIAGDSNSDYGNFSLLPKVELGLIVNHLSSGDFGKVSRQAAEQLGKPDPRWVLQGVDESIGLWSPSEKTLKMGSNEALLLRPDTP